MHRVTSTAKIPKAATGHGPRSEGAAGSPEFAVEKVSWIAVPLGGGDPVVGLGLNEHDDFKGVPTQAKVKLRLDPLAT